MERRDLVRIEGDVVEKGRGVEGGKRDLGRMDQAVRIALLFHSHICSEAT